MSERNNGTLVTALVVSLLYLGLWLWCQVTGEKPEMES